MNVSPIGAHAQVTYHQKHESFRDLVNRITTFVLKTLNVTTSVICYYINPMLFCTGLVSGVLFDKQMRQINGRLTQTWHEQNLATKVLIVLCSGLTLPFTITFLTIVKGAHLGTLMAPRPVKGNVGQ